MYLTKLLSFSVVVASRGYSLVAVHGLFFAVASLVSEHRPYGERVSEVAAQGLSLWFPGWRAQTQ